MHPNLVHADEEELLYIVAGAGLSWQDRKAWHVRAGDLLVHLPQGAAHAIVAGEEGMEVLAFGTRRPGEFAWFPRSGKIHFGHGLIFRPQLLDYFDGEEV